MCCVSLPPPQDADDTLSVEELGLEDGLVDMELLGSQGAESWKDTITRGDNGLASQYTSSVTAHTKPLSLPACHVPMLAVPVLFSTPPSVPPLSPFLHFITSLSCSSLPLCPLPLFSAPPPAPPSPRLPPYSCVAADSLVSFKTLHKLSRQLKKFAVSAASYWVCVCVR